MRPLIDLTGRKFGRLLVDGVAERGKRVTWWCTCSCGRKPKPVDGRNLRSGNSMSCGCKTIEKTIQRSTSHGGRYRTEYGCWTGIIGRCTNPNNNRWSYYGGRGITVCDRWQGENGFANFLADIGDRPSLKHSVDRFPDNNGNYEPGNCRWATQVQQTRNTRRNHMVTFNGRTMCLSDWATEIGVGVMTLYSRLKRWSVEDAMTRPNRTSKKR